MSAPHGWRLRHLQSVASTSDLCIALAQAGEPGRRAILADRQTAARGSRGRTWETLPGNLALSVLLRPNAAPAVLGHFALLAALALAEGLELCGAPRVQLKWPNDVMLEGRKLGGILLDSSIEAGRLAWVVIGFGANLAAAPAFPGVTTLPRPVGADDAAHCVLSCLDAWLARDAAAIRAAWLDRGPPLGVPLRITHAGTEVDGDFAGLSETGALLLQSPTGLTAFSTGDVLQGT